MSAAWLTRPWLWPLLIMLLALAVRLPYLLYPTLDSDMTVTGLMAMHILQGELPVFFWGQPYCGSIEAFIAAPIFALLGPSERALMLAPLAVSLVFVWLCHQIASDMWDRRAGLVAMLLAALPPFYFAWASVLPRAAYIEIPVLSLLLIWLAFRIAHRQRSWWLYFCYGLTAGVGIWTHFLIAYALLPSALYIWLDDKRIVIKRQMLLMLAGLGLGSAPFWIYNINHPWATFHYLAKPKPTVDVWQAFKGVVLQGVPTMLGAYRDGSFELVVPLASYLAWALGLALLLYVIYQCRRGLAGLLRLSVERCSGGELWLMMMASLLLVVSLTGEAAESTRRYFVPLYCAMFPLAGLAYTRLANKSRVLALVLLGVMLAFNLAGLFHTMGVTNPKVKQRYLAQQRAIQTLLKQLNKWGVTRAYAPNYWDSLRLTFAARERIIFAEPFYSRYQAYTRTVDADPKAAWVLGRDARDLEAMFNTLGASYRLSRVAGYWCFVDIKPPPHGLVEVPPAGWRARASQYSPRTPLAWDRRADTRWTPDVLQKAGQYYQLDLGRVVPEVCMLHLHSGNYHDSPRVLKVEVSLDGRDWQEAARLEARPGPYHWSAGKIMTSRVTPREDVYFRPRPVRYLRLNLLDSSKQYFWGLPELAVFRAKGPAPAPPEPNAVMAQLQALGTGSLYGDAYLMANLPRRLKPLLLQPDRFPNWSAGLPERSFVVSGAKVALALPLNAAGGARELLTRSGLSYQSKAVGGYHLFWGFKPIPSLPLLPTPQVDNARASAGEPEKALDNKPRTRWTTGRGRRAGDFYQLRLKQPQELAGIMLYSPDAPLDLSDSLQLELSADGKTWRQVKYKASRLGPLVFGGDLLLSGGLTQQQLAFAPSQVKALRLTLLKSHPLFNWSFTEIKLLGPKP